MSEYHGSVKIRFGDVDNAGIVYFPRILDYCHRVFEDFWADVAGVPYDRLVNSQRVGFPTVHISADFKRKMKYGDELDIRLSVPRIGNSSADFRYRISSRSSGEELADVTITVAAVGMDAFRAVRIPDGLRAAMAKVPGG
jgi:4-hydroxybenzoyl-CoA thioesterase